MRKAGIVLSLVFLAVGSSFAGPMEEIRALQKELFKMKIKEEKIQQEINQYQLEGKLSSTISSLDITRLSNNISKLQQEMALLETKIKLERAKLDVGKKLSQSLIIGMPNKGTVMNKYLITDNTVIEAGSDFAGLGTVRIGGGGGIVKVGPYYITNEKLTENNVNTSSSMPASPVSAPQPSSSGSSASLPPLPPLSALLSPPPQQQNTPPMPQGSPMVGHNMPPGQPPNTPPSPPMTRPNMHPSPPTNTPNMPPAPPMVGHNMPPSPPIPPIK